MVLMLILDFPMVLEMRGTLRWVVMMVTLSPLEKKSLARSMHGMMWPLACIV